MDQPEKPDYAYYFGDLIEKIKDEDRDLPEEIQILEEDEFYSWRNTRLRVENLDSKQSTDLNAIQISEFLKTVTQNYAP